jgi:gliding motility-associated-like protein
LFSDSTIVITQIPLPGTVLNLDPNTLTPFNIVVTVTDESNNTETCNFILNVYCEKLLEIPQFISPNGDGKNDTWIIKNLEAYPNNNVKIFNRWGALVFEEISYKNDWDGTLNKKGNDKYLPSGTYFYLIDVNSKVYSGYIHIQKYTSIRKSVF